MFSTSWSATLRQTLPEASRTSSDVATDTGGASVPSGLIATICVNPFAVEDRMVVTPAVLQTAVWMCVRYALSNCDVRAASSSVRFCA